jgi:hypothetical protein
MSDCGLDDRGLIPWQGLGVFDLQTGPGTIHWIAGFFLGRLTIHTRNLIT